MWYFIGGALLYVISTAICYITPIKNSPYFFPIGLTAGFLANLLWLSLAKQSFDKDQTLQLGILWDAMLTLIYVLVPVLMFGARLSGWQLAGSILILLGVGVAKL